MEKGYIHNTACLDEWDCQSIHISAHSGVGERSADEQGQFLYSVYDENFPVTWVQSFLLDFRHTSFCLTLAIHFTIICNQFSLSMSHKYVASCSATLCCCSNHSITSLLKEQIEQLQTSDEAP